MVRRAQSEVAHIPSGVGVQKLPEFFQALGAAVGCVAVEQKRARIYGTSIFGGSEEVGSPPLPLLSGPIRCPNTSFPNM